MFLVEGFYVETVEGLIFTVKGHLHPPGSVIAYLRYLPHPQGERVRGGVRYRRVYSFEEQYRVLEEGYPQYLAYDEVLDQVVQRVPLRSVVKVYDPREGAVELSRRRGRLPPLMEDALDFLELLSAKSGVKLSDLGISGSILVDMTTESSDIDVVVYGLESCYAVHEALRELLDKEEEGVAKLRSEDLRKLYRAREAVVPFEVFADQEARKTIQGRFRGREFFVRYVKKPEEVDERYGDRTYRTVGVAKIKARVIDSSDSIFTPCVYKVSDVKFLEGVEVERLVEVASFRGRFCEQAVEGDLILARGKVEAVTSKSTGESYYRLLLGGSSEDFMVRV